MPADVRRILADPAFQGMDIEERRKVLLQVDGDRFGAMDRTEQDAVLGAKIRSRFEAGQSGASPLPKGAEKTGLPGVPLVAPVPQEQNWRKALPDYIRVPLAALQTVGEAPVNLLGSTGDALEAVTGWEEFGGLSRWWADYKAKEDGGYVDQNAKPFTSVEGTANLVAGGVGSSLSFMLPGGQVGKMVGAIDKANKLSTGVKVAAQVGASATASAALETITIGGAQYREVMQDTQTKGASKELARAVAWETVKQAFPLTALTNAAEFVLPGVGSKKLAAVLGLMFEGGQEVLQGEAERNAREKHGLPNGDVNRARLEEFVGGAAGGAATGWLVGNAGGRGGQQPARGEETKPVPGAEVGTAGPTGAELGPIGGGGTTGEAVAATEGQLSAEEAALVARMEKLAGEMGQPFEQLPPEAQDQIFDLASRGVETLPQAEGQPATDETIYPTGEPIPAGKETNAAELETEAAGSETLATEAATMATAAMDAADAETTAADEEWTRPYSREQYAAALELVGKREGKASPTEIRKALGLSNQTTTALLGQMQDEGFVKLTGPKGSKFWKIVKRPEAPVEQAETQSEAAQKIETPPSLETQEADTVLDPLRTIVYQGQPQELTYESESALPVDASPALGIPQEAVEDRTAAVSPAETVRPGRDPQGKDSSRRGAKKAAVSAEVGSPAAAKQQTAKQPPAAKRMKPPKKAATVAAAPEIAQQRGLTEPGQPVRWRNAMNRVAEGKLEGWFNRQALVRLPNGRRVEIEAERVRPAAMPQQERAVLDRLREKMSGEGTHESLTELREDFPELTREQFDDAVRQLRDREEVFLHHHDRAHLIPAAEREGFLFDAEAGTKADSGKGTWFNAISTRPRTAEGRPETAKATAAKVARAVEASATMGLLRPEAVPINYLKGKPTKAQLEGGARVKYFPAQGDRPAVVSLNDQAMLTVGRILETGRAGGLAVPQNDSRRLRVELGKKIARAKGEHRAALEGLASALRRAAEENANENLVLLYGDKGVPRAELMKALREELTHYEQFRWSEDSRAQADSTLVTALPQWQRIDEYLDRVGYGRESDSRKVMEAGAQIAAGRWREMGLSLEEAADWFVQYVEAVRLAHGDKSARVTRWTTKEIRQAYGEWQDTHQRHTDTGGARRAAQGRGEEKSTEGGGSARAPRGDPREGGARSIDGRVPDGQERVRASERGTAGQEAGGVAGARGDANRPNQRSGLQPVRGDAQGSRSQGREEAAGVAERSSGGARERRFALEKLPPGAEFQRRVMRSRLDRTAIADRENAAEVFAHADAAYVPKKGLRPGAVYVNEQGRMLLDKAMQAAFGGESENVGLTLTRADVVAVNDAIEGNVQLMALGGDWTSVGRMRRVQEELRKASAAEGTVTVVSNEGPRLGDTKRTRRHESIHEALGRLDPKGEKLLGWFDGYGELLNRDSAKTAAERLRKIGYSEAEAGDELAVHIGAGQWERLGMSLDEAADYFQAYYDKLQAQYGTDATAHILERVDARIRDKYAENKKGGDNANQKPMATRASEPGEQGAEPGSATAARGDGTEVRQESARPAESGGARERRAEGEAGGDRGAGEGGRARRGVADYLAARRGAATAGQPVTLSNQPAADSTDTAREAPEARSKAQPAQGGGGRIADTGEQRTASPSPEPGSGRGKPGGGSKEADSAGKNIPVSPSYDETRGNLIARVGVDEATAGIVREQMEAWERQNPERGVVSFEDVIEEARERDPRLVLELDRKRAQDAVILDPALRQASKNAMNAISREIRTLNESLRGETMTSGERERAQRKLETLERDFQRLSDVLIPTRSQIGRMLAYENLMAQQGFDVTYWLDRAKRAAKLPDGMALPDQDIEKIREIAVKGQDAEDAAVEKAAKKRRRKKAEEQAKNELAAEGRTEPGRNDLTREQVVAKARQALLDRLDRAMVDLETAKVEPVTPAEREMWEQDPEVIARRAKLAKIRQELKARREEPMTREKEVERKRQALLDRLEARLKGKAVEVNPVKPEERALWEQDPKVLELRAEIARKFPPPPPPGLEARKAHYRKLLLDKIERLMRQEKPERKPSKWELTPEERREVERDPAVRAAAREMARAMAEQRKDGWWDYLSSLRAAGLLTAVKTHARNIIGNVNFQLFHEASRPAGMVADFAVRHFSKKAVQARTVGGISLADMKAASQAGATRGIAEAIEILKTGEVRNGQTELFDFTRELNARHLFEGRAGLKHLAWTNDAINMVFRTLKAEDRLFKQYAYERSLREQMKLAGTETATEEMMLQAWSDADFMTFNNENQFVKNWINGPLAKAEKSGLTGKAAGFVVKLFLPFRNTPANIWARVVEGMGGGLISGPLKVMAHQGMLTAAQQRAIAMEMGRGATGLGLVMLGFFGGLGGWIRGLLGDEERGQGNVERAAGMAEGAVKVGGQWISILGLSPVANLVLVGATMARRYSDPSAFVSNVDVAFAALNSTVKEQPMMRGLNDLLEAWQAKEGKAGALVSNLAGSWVPSIVSSIAESTDSVRRDARGGNMLERAGKGVMARTPGLRQMLPERLDVLGRPVEQERLGTFFGFPVTRETDNAALKEMVRVGVSMGEGKQRQTETKAQWEERAAAALQRGEAAPARMPAEEREEFAARQAAIGEAILRRVAKLMTKPDYQQADTVERQHRIEALIGVVRKRANSATKQRGYKDVPTEDRREWLIQRMGG